MFIHHFFGGFGRVGREDEQIHFGWWMVDGGWWMVGVGVLRCKLMSSIYCFPVVG